MADKVQFEVVTPTQLLRNEEADMVVVPGADGDFGVLPNHAPVLSSVRPGTVDIHEDGKVRDRLFVRGGFAEVTGERCVLLAEEAVPVSELDSAEAETALSEANDRLGNAEADSVEHKNALTDVRVAEAMVRAAGMASD
ncbi:MAG: ATP synthase F1 subunit epsilon [Rhodospirillaceae bacterium]|jgi:F-type H+-transporting ATPase subunit epsilon|nr:ATP synthase F1 subunit epsilon [Rhodospirillales bacterium]MBT3907557.1 ATP synthase F1 subunit epsilon [Rhodospirillaceae bacterium]MBT4703525.1 ATP synthase F1 subunit epsilon [Rhodospirillaceae bacterium]MBT5036293.1 ATP synthase F1 subunit epsilon [Rhodospirillaceae bacterium]MBT6219172.1 ATP synthase F1 subunit epsilon [Rhodospirillaceae bacterium]